MRRPPSGMYGTGHYLCHIGVISVPIEVVASWLPPELELAPQNITDAKHHPVNMLFGQEFDVHVHPFGFANIDYGEFAVVVPFVQWKSNSYRYKGPFLFTPLLYLDNWFGIQAGRVLYGFPKKRARFNVTKQLYEVIDAETSTRIVSCDIEQYEGKPSEHELSNIARLIQQPSLSQKTDGSYVGSGFDWQLDKAIVTSEKAKVDFENWWMPSLQTGDARTYILDGVKDFSQGGFYHLDTVWTLTLPMNPDQYWSAYLHKGDDHD